ncbi:MAG: chemotaxis protein CheW [Methylovulum sp.]|uniref:chemotaxis protein CheW n=1 Tax=Methylovulum sp. TaxID=1916980 RepID=UPI0026063DB2|nr:chemotaxis protein CheW [Methylovulum sp.]MDD2723171.1 chemotaxis protein CheW [Methylovulum sp.]MDD5124649.1 chemotaxis protein CheW [Methylovulum sp.]
MSGLVDTGFPLVPQAETQIESVFGIRIGSLGFLISTAVYCEVLDKVQVSAMPNVHPWISGLLNLRGNLVPVFDLHRVLEEKAADPKKRRLFAIDRGDKAAALWIDSFPEIKNSASLLPLEELPLLAPILQAFVTGAYEQDGQVWLKPQFEDFFKVLGHHQHKTEETVT